MANPPPSSFHLNEAGMLLRSRRLNSGLSQASTSTVAATTPSGGTTSDGFSDPQYASGTSHLPSESEPDSPLSYYSNAPSPANVPPSSLSASFFSSTASSARRQSHRTSGGRDSDASASGASSFGPERTSGSSSPIASTSGSSHPSNVNPATGKRKRSRVSPSQLSHLERVFSKDRSPTAAKRKEMAEQLGMSERQTQVWFQNRRAKAKLLEQRARAGRPPVQRTDNSGSSSGASYATGASGAAGYGGAEPDADALARIHEDEAVFIIPTNDLCIGTFRRVSAGLNDLIGYICEPRQYLAWYIYSAGTGFKMEIAFEHIQSVNMVDDAMQGHSRATITLSAHPIFYREFVAPFDTYGMGHRQWQRCDDWTENRQATSGLVHVVVARTAALEHALGAWLPREANVEDGGSGVDVEDSRPQASPIHRGASGLSSRRSSRDPASPAVSIQTPSLPAAFQPPHAPHAPPSSYRDPFTSPRSPAATRATYSSAPQLPHTALSRKRSRSDASSPYGYFSSEYDQDYDPTGGRHSTGSGAPHAHHSHAHHSHLHPIATPSSLGRTSQGPFSAGPFGSHDASFASQQDQPLSAPGGSGRFDHSASVSFSDFDSLLSYGGGGAAAGGSGAGGDDSFLPEGSVGIARSYSTSHVPPAGRSAQMFGLGASVSRPATAASHHSLSHSPYDSHATASMPPPPPPSHPTLHHSVSTPQTFSDMLASGMASRLSYDGSLSMEGFHDMGLVFPPGSEGSGYGSGDANPQPPQLDGLGGDSTFPALPSSEESAVAQQFLQTPQDENAPTLAPSASATLPDDDANPPPSLSSDFTS